jgi:hypothetical protein
MQHFAILIVSIEMAPIVLKKLALSNTESCQSSMLHNSNFFTYQKT